MSLDFFKKWYRGKPSKSLDRNDSNISHWLRGQPVSVFSSVLGNVVAYPETLSLTSTQYDVTIAQVLAYPDILSMSLDVSEPVVFAGRLVSSQVLTQVEYAKPSRLVSSQVLIQVESSVYYDVTVGVEVLSLTLTLHEVQFPYVGYAPLLNLTLSLLSPQVRVSFIEKAETLHLNLDLRAVSTKQGSTILNDLLHLIFTQHSVLVTTGVKLYETLNLILEQYTPEVGYGIIALVPEIKRLRMSKIPPSINTQTCVLTKPNLLHTVLSQQVPNVHIGTYISEVLPLLLTAPEVSLISHNYIDLDAQHLMTSALTVNATVGSTFIASPLHLVLSHITVNVKTGVCIGESISMLLDLCGPETLYGCKTGATCNHLIFNVYDPIFWTPDPTTYNRDPLHKEREWAAHFNRDLYGWMMIPDANLSPGFPLKSEGGARQFTISMWVRFASAGNWRRILAKQLDPLGSSRGDGFAISQRESAIAIEWAGESLKFVSHNLGIDKWFHVSIYADADSRFLYARIWDEELEEVVVEREWDSERDSFQSPLPDPFYDYPFQLGHSEVDDAGDSDYFDGYLDEVVIFDALRTPLELEFIRKRMYDGQLESLMIEEFGTSIGNQTSQKITVDEFGGTIGVRRKQYAKTDEFGVMVGYHITSPPTVPPFNVIPGDPGYQYFSDDKCTLRYKFISDVFVPEQASTEDRHSRFHFPTREFDVATGDTQTGAFLRMLETHRAGLDLCSVPIWPLRQLLSADAKKGDSTVIVDDNSDFCVGDKALLIRATDGTIFDLCTVSGLSGNSTIEVEEALTNNYKKFSWPTKTREFDERSSYFVPCITGIITAEEDAFTGSRPTYYVKLHADGGVWAGAEIPATVPLFLGEPLSATYLGPQVDRRVIGSEHGLLEFYKHLIEVRIAFELEWSFHDSNWKELRELFFAARGRDKAFYLPTWAQELRFTAKTAAGGTSVSLTQGFNQIWSRFTKILVKARSTPDVFIITLSEHQGNDVYTCSELPYDVVVGDKASFVPKVRFLEDEIEFEFMGIQSCTVKATFVEASS